MTTDGTHDVKSVPAARRGFGGTARVVLRPRTDSGELQAKPPSGKVPNALAWYAMFAP